MKILFICTHNLCRSILAEAITNHIGKGKILAKSAGSQPSGNVHPLTLKYLSEAGISTDGLCSQSWDAHETWQPDVVITVCDAANGEQCPVWFGKSIKIHWGLADPSKVEGSPEQIKNAFQNTITLLTQRLSTLLKANPDSLSRDEIISLLINLGK